MGVHALYTAATGMDAQLRNIDVIANNVANLNTDGFKRDRVNFADLFYRQAALAGAAGPSGTMRPSGIHIGHGVHLISTQKLFEPGGVIQTGDDLHLSIQGPANIFFEVERPDGTTAYTRAGNFTLDGEGRVVTPAGDLLQPEVLVPPEYVKISVSRDGIVEVLLQPGEEPQEVARLRLARFGNPAGLRPVGDNLFYATGASGEAQQVSPGQPGAGSILQGALEGSNVNAIRELIQLIQGQRAYEINSNVIRTADEALQIANNLRG